MIPIITTVLALLAGFLTGLSIGGIWDQFASRFVADLHPMLSSLSMNPKEYSAYLRWSGIACVLSLVVLGYTLNMFPIAIAVTLLVFLRRGGSCRPSLLDDGFYCATRWWERPSP